MVHLASLHLSALAARLSHCVPEKRGIRVKDLGSLRGTCWRGLRNPSSPAPARCPRRAVGLPRTAPGR
eukprot:5790637-Lingulodinium_polyedra.AAC.1